MKDYHKYNLKNGYGLSYIQLRYWIRAHQKARESNNTARMQWIEDMLSDANFHREASLLSWGEYEQCVIEVKEIFHIKNRRKRA